MTVHMVSKCRSLFICVYVFCDLCVFPIAAKVADSQMTTKDASICLNNKQLIY